MDVRAAYTDDEWKQVKDLASVAALLIVGSGGSGPMQVVMESGAAAKAIAAARTNPDPLVAAVVADLSDRDDTDKPAAPDVKDRGAYAADALEQARTTAELIRAKTPDHAEAYGQWILHIAERVAHAAKEGSVLGIGGARVSPEEQESLDALADALSVPSQPT